MNDDTAEKETGGAGGRAQLEQDISPWDCFHKELVMILLGPQENTHIKSVRTHTHTRTKQQEVVNGQVLLLFCSEHFSGKRQSVRSHNHHQLLSSHSQQLPNVLRSDWIHNLVIVSHTASLVIYASAAAARDLQSIGFIIGME